MNFYHSIIIYSLIATLESFGHSDSTNDQEQTVSTTRIALDKQTDLSLNYELCGRSAVIIGNATLFNLDGSPKFDQFQSHTKGSNALQITSQLAANNIYPLVNETTELVVYYINDKFPIISSINLPCDSTELIMDALNLSGPCPLIDDEYGYVCYIYNIDKFPIILSMNVPIIDPLRGDYYYFSLNEHLNGADEYLSQYLNQYPSHPDKQYLFLNNFETKRVGRLQVATIEGEGTEDKLYRHVCGIECCYPNGTFFPRHMASGYPGYFYDRQELQQKVLANPMQSIKTASSTPPVDQVKSISLILNIVMLTCLLILGRDKYKANDSKSESISICEENNHIPLKKQWNNNILLTGCDGFDGINCGNDFRQWNDERTLLQQQVQSLRHAQKTKFIPIRDVSWYIDNAEWDTLSMVEFANNILQICEIPPCSKLTETIKNRGMSGQDLWTILDDHFLFENGIKTPEFRRKFIEKVEFMMNTL